MCSTQSNKENAMVELSGGDIAAQTQKCGGCVQPRTWQLQRVKCSAGCLLDSYFFGCVPAGTPGELSCETFPDAIVEQQWHRTTQH